MRIGEKERGKIFNSLTDPKKSEPTDKDKIVDIKKDAKPDEDDDWGAIPAFLRRSRLK